MPITLPPFAQFQAPLFPLRGLWNSAPEEGDKFVNAEIDWGSLGVSCVQFQLSGNSPVAFSQIVAMSVDNSRCNSDVDFIFPDSGFVLTVPAFNQGVYPVFTNALMFYANSPGASQNDVTIVQILNSQPPPVAIQPSFEQGHAGVTGQPIQTNASSPIVPAPISGTLNGFSISYVATGTGVAQISLVDGQAQQLWQTVVEAPANGSFNLSGLHLRFNNGINVVISGSTITSGTVNSNVYYSVP